MLNGGHLQLWRKYLTNTKVSYVENDADCATKHRAEIESVAKGKVYVGKAPQQESLTSADPQFTTLSHQSRFSSFTTCSLHVHCLLRIPLFVAGDQEDVNVLSEILEDAKTFSGYDIIVDDGGHKASQMLASFKVSITSEVANSKSTG